MGNNNDIIPLAVKELFSDNTIKYIIPIYQRNFAWREAQIKQLIEDIADYAYHYPTKKYYIGTLIVYKRNQDTGIRYDTIDGQQRLTTLMILLSTLKNKFNCKKHSPENWFRFNLGFESREISTATLQNIFEDRIRPEDKLNTRILQAYDDIHKYLSKLEKEKQITVEKFCQYLYDKVVILRVQVPDDTDLNHYFEIMNNRGEQLEKQEFLKAKLLEIIHDDKKAEKTFNLIWEACSNMEKYVQYGFRIAQRDVLFGSDEQDAWNKLMLTDFDSIKDALFVNEDDSKNDENEEEDRDEIALSIEDIIRKDFRNPETSRNDEDTPERFTSPINFSNFLLQVLRIQTGKNIPLDDKRLLITFEDYLPKDNTEEKDEAKKFVKEFGYNLLRFKFLLDKYIIKREFLKGKDGWSLKHLKRRKSNRSYSGYYVNTFGDEAEVDGENKNIIMLLSMFHVSAPTLIYKHWLNAALKYVSEHEHVIPADYIEYLENLAEAYLYDRYLAKRPLDYDEIIYKNNGIKVNANIDLSLLDKGTDVENFIFNYLDYLLWKDDKEDAKPKYESFEFSFRSSVEHFYPQHPFENIKRLDDEILNDFGNLCLISRRKNSRLGNLTPEAKKSYYLDNPSKDSIKQAIMMGYENWTETEIKEHGKEMKKILQKIDEHELFVEK